MAHTPGPWTARQCDGQILLNGSNCYEVREVFNPQGGFNPEDILLMAAAPELLRELKRLLPLWEEAIGYEDDYMDMGDAARAAIAEAEGRGE